MYLPPAHRSPAARSYPWTRDTDEYRTGAYHFFRDRYGIEVDPAVVGDQVVEVGGGSVPVQAIKTGEGSTHQVYAIDAQQVSRWRGRFPLTTVAFRDDGYVVFALSDVVVNGTMRPLDGGRMNLDFRYVMHFPSRLANTTTRRPRCDFIRPIDA
ncbi:MAG: hypothetical protein AAF547_01485 [Actinomycetota bacterium]